MRRAGLLIAISLAMCGWAAPAQANFIAEGTDPAGDATTGEPQRDLTGVSFAYDRRTGAMEAAIKLAAEPRPTRSFITIAAGQRTATGCDGYPAITFGAYTDDLEGTWSRLEQPGVPSVARGEADKRGINAQVQSFEIEDEALAGGSYDCVVALLSEPGNPANTYDGAEADLVGQPALSLSIKGVPKRMRVGASKTVRLTMRNTGDGPAAGVRVTLKRAKGLAVKPARRSFGTLAPGARRTTRMRLTMGKRAAAVSELGVSGGSGKLRLKGSLEIRRAGSSGGGGGGGGNQPGTPSTCVQYSPDLFGDSGGSLVLVPCVR